MSRFDSPRCRDNLRRNFCRVGALALALSFLAVVFSRAEEAQKAASNVPMTRPGELLALHKTKYFHSSTFVELAGGRILHAAGTTFTTSDDGGLTWSKPFQQVDTQGNPVGGSGTSLVKLNGKGIGLAATRRNLKAKTPLQQSRSNHIVFWRSQDGGKTWQPPVRVSAGGFGTQCLQDVLLRTSSGRIILPVYIALGQDAGPDGGRQPGHGILVRGQWVPTSAHFFDPRFTASFVYYSDDDGRTWERNEDGELLILRDWNALYSYTNEPTVAEVAPKKLLMLMRTGLGRLYQSWSNDDGTTWTRPQPTALAASPAPAQLRRLPSGHLLVVWNQEGEQEIKRGYNRTRLSAAISRNGGSVWEFFQNIESLHEQVRVEPGPIRPVRPVEIHFEPGKPAPEREVEHITPAKVFGRWSYPSVFVLKDRVFIAHTYDIWEDHPTEARLQMSRDVYNQKLKVLPLTWFYGGKQPADNPFLSKAREPARP